jgi:hypothetical protein
MKSLLLIAGQRSDHVRLGGGTLKTLMGVGVGHCGEMSWIVQRNSEMVNQSRASGVFRRRLPLELGSFRTAQLGLDTHAIPRIRPLHSNISCSLL